MRFLFIIFALFLLTERVSFAATNIATDDLEGITATDETASEGDKNNQLASSICQLILLLNGRTGRAIAVIAIIALAFMFTTSKIPLSVFVTFIVGMALLFGAKSIALVMLPSYVNVKDADRGSVKRSPEELIKQVCPELK